MREFKFRAWDERNKIMFYDFNFIKSGDVKEDWIIPIGWWEKLQKEIDYPQFSRQQFKIMQYTGLKDKNEKEIYDGDIVEIDMQSPLKNEYSIINFKRCCFMADSLPLYLLNEALIEVIGNIYENKNLIQEIIQQGEKNDKRREV